MNNWRGNLLQHLNVKKLDFTKVRGMDGIKEATLDINGKVLKEANVDLNDVNYTLNFNIHIVNNLNQKFSYNMSLNVDLNDDNGGIYNGYVYRGKTTSGKEYRFFKEM